MTQLIDGEVRAIGRGGDAVVETARGIVLTPGALPGERVVVEPAAAKRGARRGRLRRIERVSPARVKPACGHAARCGGCPLMIANPALQREIKLGFLRDAIAGLPGAEQSEIRWVASPDELGYRRRARLAWHGDALGYRQLHAKRVTDIDDCIVLALPLRSAWRRARAALQQSLRGSGEIQLLQSGPDRAVVLVDAAREQDAALFDACARLSQAPGIAGVSLRTGDAGAAATWGAVDVSVGAGDDALLAPPGGFFQANGGVNSMLVETVAELAEPEGARVLELHCGVGNFTTALASRGPASLVAVEQDSAAVSACQANLERRGLTARVAVGDASRPPKGRYDVVVLDPPRQGARALFEESDRFPGPKRIVYVSCDTATLGRDLEIVTGKGYRIDRVIGFDMFPQTAHLESLVRLVRI